MAYRRRLHSQRARLTSADVPAQPGRGRYHRGQLDDIVLEPDSVTSCASRAFRIVPDDSHRLRTRIHPPPRIPGPGAAPAEL